MKNTDDSLDSYFVPTAPKGFEKNWIPTVPGQVWFNQINETDETDQTNQTDQRDQRDQRDQTDQTDQTDETDETAVTCCNAINELKLSIEGQRLRASDRQFD